MPPFVRRRIVTELAFNSSYTVNDHATINLGYQYVLKDADPSSLSYYQDLVTLGFRYQF